MTGKSKPKKSEKRQPAYRYQPTTKREDPDNFPDGAAPGRGFVVLNGERHYIKAPYKSPEGWKLFWETVHQWEKNGCKPLPTHVKTGISVEELATKFLIWASETDKKGKPRYSAAHFSHLKTAMQFLIDHFGKISVNDFTRHSLKFLQEKLETCGNVKGVPYCRPSVNKYIAIIVKAFEEGEERGWGIPEALPGLLKKVRPLREGQTMAPEYELREPVEIEAVKATLPFIMSEMVRDMVQAQLICTMRSQDVIHLCGGSILIDPPGYPPGTWFYEPFTHKTKHRGKRLFKAIPPEAQEILRPYIEAKKDNPEACLFSPKDAVKKYRQELSDSRKTPVQPSQKKRAERTKKRTQKRAPGEKYRVDSYRTAIQRAIARAQKAGVDVPHWFPHLLRHRSVSETNARFGKKAASNMAGHSDTKVTEGYIHQIPTELKRMAKVARKQERIFS